MNQLPTGSTTTSGPVVALVKTMGFDLWELISNYNRYHQQDLTDYHALPIVFKDEHYFSGEGWWVDIPILSHH